MLLDTILILFSAISFLIYGWACLKSDYLFTEFQRFRLGRFRNLTGILEILGSIGLTLGFIIPIIGVLASIGLSILMLLGFCVRLKIRDGFIKSSPAFLYMILNSYLVFVFIQNTPIFS